MCEMEQCIGLDLVYQAANYGLPAFILLAGMMYHIFFPLSSLKVFSFEYEKN